jgi:hypothetical protein
MLFYQADVRVRNRPSRFLAVRVAHGSVSLGVVAEYPRNERAQHMLWIGDPRDGRRNEDLGTLPSLLACLGMLLAPQSASRRRAARESALTPRHVVRALENGRNGRLKSL